MTLTPPTDGSARLAALTGAVWILFAVVVYLPDVGRGFVKDDFAWIKVGRAVLEAPRSMIEQTTPGFYRPVVAGSFAVNELLHGLRPRPYGLTNFLLYLACAVAVAALLRQVGLTLAASALGAFAWALNPHGINMAVVWISGRTSLLLTLCSALAALAFLRRHRVVGAALVFCSVMSKEEAVMLPLILGVLVAVDRPGERMSVIGDVAVMAIAIGAYFLLRVRTPAFTPATAPSFYQLTTDGRLLVANAFGYLDRGATSAAALLLLVALACWRRPRFNARLFLAAAVWFVAGYAITVRVPVRSSLYAVFPSVGAALLCGLGIDAVKQLRTPAAFERRVGLVIVLGMLLIPIYRDRNRRWVEPARVSERTMTLVRQDAVTLPSVGTVVFEDEPDPVSNFRSAFGALATEALQLNTARPLLALVIEPGQDQGPGATPANVVAWYRLTHGRVIRLH